MIIREISQKKSKVETNIEEEDLFDDNKYKPDIKSTGAKKDTKIGKEEDLFGDTEDKKPTVTEEEDLFDNKNTPEKKKLDDNKTESSKTSQPEGETEKSKPTISTSKSKKIQQLAGAINIGALMPGAKGPKISKSSNETTVDENTSTDKPKESRTNTNENDNKSEVKPLSHPNKARAKMSRPQKRLPSRYTGEVKHNESPNPIFESKTVEKSLESELSKTKTEDKNNSPISQSKPQQTSLDDLFGDDIFSSKKSEPKKKMILSKVPWNKKILYQNQRKMIFSKVPRNKKILHQNQRKII